MSGVKLLLVGIGGYGENYIKEVLTRSIPDLDKVYIADPFASRSALLGEIKERGIEIYDSTTAFFESGNRVDLAVISSPIHTHYGYIMECFDHGVNVLCEKPVTVSLEKMEEIVKRSRETGLFCAVGYQLCYSPDVIEMKRDILSGRLGRPLRMKTLRLMRRGDKYYSRTGWAGKLRAGNELVLDSPLSNACGHQMQMMLFLSGKNMHDTAVLTSVTGHLDKARPDIENFDGCRLAYESEEGVRMYYYSAHCLDEKKVGPLFEAEFEKGRIVGVDDNFTAYFSDGTVKHYTEKGERLEKLYASLRAVKGEEELPSDAANSIGHIKSVLLAATLPVYIRLDAVKRVSEDGDAYYAIPKLKDEYTRLYEDWMV